MKVSLRRVTRSRRNSQPVWPRNGTFNLLIGLIVGAVIGLFAFFDGPIITYLGVKAQHLEPLFEFITRFGLSAWILVSSGVLALAIAFFRWAGHPMRQRAAAANLYLDCVFVFASVALSGTAISLLKNTIGRARPRWMEELGPYAFDFGAFQPSFASFPSGHATTFGALCMALALLAPRWRWVMLILAMLGGASRAFVGAHYPSDIVAGLACGAVITLLIARYLAQRGIMFSLPAAATLPMRRRYRAANPFSKSFFKSLKSSNPI